MLRTRWSRDLILFAVATLLAAGGFVLLGVNSTSRPNQPAAHKSIPVQDAQGQVSKGYFRQETCGFDVYFNRSWFDPESQRGRQILEVQRRQIELMTCVFPPAALERIREADIWVEWDIDGVPGAKRDTDGYYGGSAYKSWPPGPTALRRPPRVHQGVIVFASLTLDGGSAERLLRQFPYWLAHELAHAYHDRALGCHDAAIISAYQAAMEAHLYDRVRLLRLDDSGEWLARHDRAYAATNPDEYFAELTVAYLAWNSYFPHNRAELQKHDPRGYALMAKVWGQLNQ